MVGSICRQKQHQSAPKSKSTVWPARDDSFAPDASPGLPSATSPTARHAKFMRSLLGSQRSRDSAPAGSAQAQERGGWLPRWSPFQRLIEGNCGNQSAGNLWVDQQAVNGGCREPDAAPWSLGRGIIVEPADCDKSNPSPATKSDCRAQNG